MFFIKSENRCTDRSSSKLYLGEEKQYETISVYFESLLTTYISIEDQYKSFVIFEEYTCDIVREDLC